MSNDLMIKTNEGALAVADVRRAFKQAAEERKNITGTFLKFIQGDWIYGQAGQTMSVGTEMIAVASKMKRGWVKWHDGKPIEQKIILVASGQRMANRQQLGDLDQTAWDVGMDGTPRDPWQKTYYLPMVAKNGSLYTFTTNSIGGENCCLELGDFYADHIAFEPNDLPVVKLGVGSYLNKKTRGRTKFPTLVIQRWVPASQIADALEAPVDDNDDGGFPEHENPGDGMDDEIPF